ncbi:gluconate 2-dehydrogenase subunit 3 family protein [Chitinophagaceae bacterium LB-8]|uniref:Gluconate 2-dehydrogenase subunit 3 family protein n=1 Tax=Paraflavisolibacter caeni TaxID=2982496 RepID=A0A9X2XVX6_9BACT|nr:gluconate 2-dehydrogenase subunit 3 family protein [Paraflavisolibacter caeni]MCU7549597.1 gluconate 2-dehydrogenase subunit 3 family protein [Paraflavisolibacter caeni]
MNRRESLKALSITAISTGVLLGACKTKDEVVVKGTSITANEDEAGLQHFEVERNQKLLSEKFFTDHEMATITVLGDIIIPRDERSGSASDAKVPEFIEFIVKDIPEHQVPMRGGLRWLDMQCLKRFNNSFIDCTAQQQIEIVDEIAYPAKANPEMQQGVAFFNRMRSLTASGFFTSKMGIGDLGYMGNRPGKWTGVPAEVLQQYNMQDHGYEVAFRNIKIKQL